MKTVRNFEALFLVVAATATFATYAMAEVPHHVVTKPTAAALMQTSAPMQVVVIKGQRLSAAQKAAL
jgi:hypothetical protein